MRSALGSFLLSSLALALVGCDGRPSRVPVTGTVTFDGQPLQEGTIIFEIAGTRPATGKIVDGKIVDVFTFSPGDGAIPGQAKAAVFATAPPAPAAATATPAADPSAAAGPAANYMGGGPSLVPVRYNDTATSGLEYEIKADGANDFQVTLTK